MRYQPVSLRLSLDSESVPGLLYVTPSNVREVLWAMALSAECPPEDGLVSFARLALKFHDVWMEELRRESDPARLWVGVKMTLHAMGDAWSSPELAEMQQLAGRILERRGYDVDALLRPGGPKNSARINGAGADNDD